MDDEKLIELTKQWIMIMLFDTNKSTDDLIINGCKLMIYGHKSYDDVENIIMMLESEKKIQYNRTNGMLRLTSRGMFEVKKHTFLPLEKITESVERYEAFVAVNREKCDIGFLESLMGSESNEKIRKIQGFSEQNYQKVLKIIKLIAEFMSPHTKIFLGN